MLEPLPHPRRLLGPHYADPLIKEARDRQRRRRRGIFALSVVLVLGVGGIYGGLHAWSTGLGISTLPSGASTTPLFGFARSYATASTVARVDAKSLKLTGKKLHVSESVNPVGLSPDGTRLLLLNTPQVTKRNRGEPSLSIVDLKTMRFESGVQPRINADLERSRAVSAVWPTAHQLLVVAQSYGNRRWRRGPHTVTAQTLLAINPRTGALGWKRHLSKTLSPTQAAVVGRTGVLVLQSTNRRRRQATIMTISAGGVVRSSTITPVKAGYGLLPVQLVVASGRAYALTGGNVIYSIDPVSARATPHRIPTPKEAPDVSPPDLLLGGAALGNNIVVSSFFARSNGSPASGIYVIDPANWNVHLVDPKTPAWIVANDALVTFTDAGQFRFPASWRSRGTGIRIYDQQGRLLRHLYGTQAFAGVTATPAFAIAVLPSRLSRTTPPQSPAQYRARDASVRLHELLFSLPAGRQLGRRVEIGQPPGLIRPQSFQPHS
jgi:hypothetical protein